MAQTTQNNYGLIILNPSNFQLRSKREILELTLIFGIHFQTYYIQEDLIQYILMIIISFFS